MPALITISALSTPIPSGMKALQGSVNIPNPIGGVVDSSFPAAQSNTITVPAGATACIIAPPSASTVALTLKGIAGDTGVPISPSQPCLISFATAPPASFVITSGAAVVGVVEVSFV